MDGIASDEPILRIREPNITLVCFLLLFFASLVAIALNTLSGIILDSMLPFGFFK